MIHVASDRFLCDVPARAKPVVEVARGSMVSVHCRHACDREVGKGPDRAPAANPATGPIAVAGARPGEALRIDILDIMPESTGHVSAGRGKGQHAIPIRDGMAEFSETICIPIAPMIGVLGVAPAQGSWSTMDCGAFGGNLDTSDIAPGATVYLPVFQPGGLLVLGDVHAVMGDGEIGGQGLEVAAEVALSVDVVAEPICRAITIVRDGELMTLGTGETLGEACDDAARAMAGLIVDADILDEFTAMKFLGLAGQLRVGQQCCRTKSARVAVPLERLPALRARLEACDGVP